MSLEKIEEALLSVKDFPGGVICIGGEPTMHDDFYNVSKLWAEYVNRPRRAIFYGRHPGGEVQRWINQIYPYQTFNDHYGGSWHKPLFVTGQDMGLPITKILKNIDRCMINHIWCPSINENGAYFCEVAATIDRFIAGGKHAMNVKPGWWKRDIPEQQKLICQYCGLAQDFPPVRDNGGIEYISAFWAKIFKPEDLTKFKMVLDISEMQGAPYTRYAQKDGLHHWNKATLPIWLRQKRFGMAYRAKKIWWKIKDMIGGN
jgi:hypothetical protein